MSLDLTKAAQLVPGLVEIGKFAEFGSDAYTLYSMGFSDLKTAVAGLPRMKEADADRAIAAVAGIMKIMWALAANPRHSTAAMAVINGIVA